MSQDRNNSSHVLGITISIVLMTFSLWCLCHTVLWVMPLNIAKYMIVGIVLNLAVVLLVKRAKLFSVIPVYLLIAVLLLRLILALNTEVRMRYFGSLYEAIHTGNPGVVQRRIEDGCNINETIDGDPLVCHVFRLYAYRHRYEPGPSPNVREKKIVEILKVLINNGAHVDAIDGTRGWPALFWAITSFNTEAVKLLVSKGANVTCSDNDGYTVLHYAQLPEMTQILIDAGADVNAIARNGNRPLHMAPPLETAEILISHGADVSAQNKAGETPLDLAIREADEQLAALLKKEGS